MTLPTTRQPVAFWILLLGTAFLSLWQIGRLPLLDSDEPVYGEVGRLMASSGSLARWLTPHYNGALWFDKPPLFYWLTALSMKIQGASEMAARMPSALCAVGLVAATCALARRAYPQAAHASLWAGFVVSTTVQFILLARAAVTDMTLALTLILALLCLFAWLETNQPRWIFLTGLLTGLACLAKGPVALILIGLQLIAYLACTRRWEKLLSISLWTGFAACLAVALPWYCLMIHLHGQAFIRGFLEANNVTRYLQPEHKETNNIFWYIPIFIAVFVPWTLTVPGMAAAAIQRNRAERTRPDAPRPTLFLSLWCILIFVFFSLSQTKLHTYIFPMLPAASTLVGIWIAERLAQPALESRRMMAAFAVLLVLLALGLAIVGHMYQVVPVTFAVWMTVLLPAALFCIWGRDPQLRWAAPGIATVLVLLAAWCSPTWNVRAYEASDRTPARIAAAASLPGAPVYALGLKHPSLVYYSGRHVVFTDDRAQTVHDIMAYPDRIYIVRTVDLKALQSKYGLRAYRLLYASHKTSLIAGTGCIAPAEVTP